MAVYTLTIHNTRYLHLCANIAVVLGVESWALVIVAFRMGY